MRMMNATYTTGRTQPSMQGICGMPALLAATHKGAHHCEHACVNTPAEAAELTCAALSRLGLLGVLQLM